MSTQQSRLWQALGIKEDSHITELMDLSVAETNEIIDIMLVDNSLSAELKKTIKDLSQRAP
ncbi:MAG: hypothetical protein CL811_02765 [Colwelliaceae bacterium]|nr:hypothetical protein [Colwelliaceae bacterium]|tara:strand:- start:439 stop:621 length:183 start_codon:yes stop_codon:yes gene_type:complete